LTSIPNQARSHKRKTVKTKEVAEARTHQKIKARRRQANSRRTKNLIEVRVKKRRPKKLLKDWPRSLPTLFSTNTTR